MNAPAAAFVLIILLFFSTFVDGRRRPSPSPSPFLDTELGEKLSPPSVAGEIRVVNLTDGTILLSMFCKNEAVRRILSLSPIPPVDEMMRVANKAVAQKVSAKQGLCEEDRLDEWVEMARGCMVTAEAAMRKTNFVVPPVESASPAASPVPIGEINPPSQADVIFVNNGGQFLILNIACREEAASLLVGEKPDNFDRDVFQEVANEATARLGKKKEKLCKKRKITKWMAIARECLKTAGRALLNL